MVTWTCHWKQCNFGNQNFFKVDSFSESREKNEYAIQKILTSILFELFNFEVRDAGDADCGVGDAECAAGDADCAASSLGTLVICCPFG